MSSAQRMRADQALVERGLVRSRSLARRLIDDGAVSVSESGRREIVARPSRIVAGDARLEVAGSDESRYVSRAGAKLAAALAETGVDCRGVVALDVGMSTGGFADCLLAHGAAAIVGIEVGHGQLAPSLAADRRVHCFELTHVGRIDPVRWLAANGLAPFGLVASDLSFISGLGLLDQLAALAAPEAVLLMLVKPQFELGPAAVSRSGRVSDAAGAALQPRAFAAASAAGWEPRGWHRSRLRGTDGNQEYFLHARRGPEPIASGVSLS